MDAVTQTQPLTVLIDPRIAAGRHERGSVEQHEHNVKMRELQARDAAGLAARDARGRLQNATAPTPRRRSRSGDLRQARQHARAFATTSRACRRRQLPGEHDVEHRQKIGRDAISLRQLKKELDAIRAEAR